MKSIKQLKYPHLLSLSSNQLLSMGITERVIRQLEEIGAIVDNLYFNNDDWAFPIIYFDKNINFEFRFTAFQSDWSDRSQLVRFFRTKQQHILSREESTNILTLN